MPRGAYFLADTFVSQNPGAADIADMAPLGRRSTSTASA